MLEWVGPDDAQVRRLLAQRTTPYAWYEMNGFLRAFSEFFRITGSTVVAGTDRVIYQFERLS